MLSLFITLARRCSVPGPFTSSSPPPLLLVPPHPHPALLRLALLFMLPSLCPCNIMPAPPRLLVSPLFIAHHRLPDATRPLFISLVSPAFRHVPLIPLFLSLLYSLICSSFAPVLLQPLFIHPSILTSFLASSLLHYTLLHFTFHHFPSFHFSITLILSFSHLSSLSYFLPYLPHLSTHPHIHHLSTPSPLSLFLFPALLPHHLNHLLSSFYLPLAFPPLFTSFTFNIPFMSSFHLRFLLLLTILPSCLFLHDHPSLPDQHTWWR